jgi:hypothetical protein
MKRLLASTTVLLLLAGTCLADDKTAIDQAQAAAKDWLTLTDGAKYAQSWEEAASLFKAAVTKANWESALIGTRTPLGTLKSRKVKGATFTRTLPGAPDGEYVVIQYDTQFEKKAAAVETVTPMREKDGSWRVSGYFIK